jgi:hypothetical protein
MFLPGDRRQRRCFHSCGRTRKGRSSSSSHGARARKRAAHDVRFVGVDGEGEDRCARGDSDSADDVAYRALDAAGFAADLNRVCDHHYVLLTVGTVSLIGCVCGLTFTHDSAGGDHDATCPSCGCSAADRRNGARLRGRDLDFTEIAPFLYEQFQAHRRNGGKVAFVGFYLGYDFARWFRSLPPEVAKELLDREKIAARKDRSPHVNNPRPQPVSYAGWQFDIMADKRFRLRPDGDDRLPWLYVCDAGSFWQTSLLKAIAPKGWTDPVVSPEQYALIAAGKDRRATARLDADMIRYNVEENRALAALMSALNRGFLSMGVRLKADQWYGPGQAAQHWLNNLRYPGDDKARFPTGDVVRDTMPAWAVDAWRDSYFGGWFEIPVHGHITRPAHTNDIHSAYPAQMAGIDHAAPWAHLAEYRYDGLPCLLHGTWERLEGPPPDDEPWCAVRGEVWGSDRYLGAMLHRNPEGGVLRPHHTVGTFVWRELQAARRAGLIDRYEISESAIYHPDGTCPCARPLAGIGELYRQRVAVGKNTALGKAMKLVYNSVYGKLAQSVGTPKYGNAFYAAEITAGCRTMILDAIASHPQRSAAVAMIATDGIAFLTEHPTLIVSDPDDGERLGCWDHEQVAGLTLIRPGIYWDDTARADPASLAIKARGHGARTMRGVLTELDTKFAGFDGYDWPRADLVIPFTVTSPRLTAARAGPDPSPERFAEAWAHAGEVIHNRTVEMDTAPTGKRVPFAYRDRKAGVWRSPVIAEPDPLESTPYDKMFGQVVYVDDYMTPDGPGDMVSHEAITLGLEVDDVGLGAMMLAEVLTASGSEG